MLYRRECGGELFRACDHIPQNVHERGYATYLHRGLLACHSRESRD